MRKFLSENNHNEFWGILKLFAGVTKYVPLSSGLLSIFLVKALGGFEAPRKPQP